MPATGLTNNAYGLRGGKFERMPLRKKAASPAPLPSIHNQDGMLLRKKSSIQDSIRLLRRCVMRDCNA